MPCTPIVNTETGDTEGILCTGGPTYDFEGWFFEIHPQCGPNPLNRLTWEPRTISGESPFWPVWDRFEKLSAEDRAKYESESPMKGRRKRRRA